MARFSLARSARQIAGGAALGTLVATAPGTCAAAPSTLRPASTQTGNTTGEAFNFLNTNAAGGGLMGQVGPSVYAAQHAGLAGVFNPASTTVGFGVFALSTTSDAIYAKSTDAASAGLYGTGPSDGVIGQSNTGNGVLGKTASTRWFDSGLFFPFDSLTYSGHAGVLGSDTSAPPPDRNQVNENAGVAGFSENGLAGVLGVLTAASPYGSEGGVLGTNYADGASGLFGRDASTGTTSNGLYASSSEGTGITTFSSAGEGINVYSGANIALEVDNATLNKVPPLLVQSDVQGDPSYPVVIVRNVLDGSSANDIFSISATGNVIATGTISGSASPLDVTRGSHGERVVAYGARSTSPTIEDYGTATMTGGYASVRVDAAFASTMDPHAGYAVFLSPEGENNGLYVTAKTAASFVVREVHGGRSTLPFSYRILARPLDMPLAGRLPDARTAVVPPQFDDRKERAMNVYRKAQRERISKMFASAR
jgi:hypothetical protein